MPSGTTKIVKDCRTCSCISYCNSRVIVYVVVVMHIRGKIMC
jgi:hypothetical protein